MIEKEHDFISISRQCELLKISKSGLYYQPVEAEDDLVLKTHIDKIYTDYPFYGSRRIAVTVSEILNQPVNRKRVQRLMRAMGIAGIAPGPLTTRPSPGHKIYPYLLRGLRPLKPLHVWSTDITYVRLDRGFAYLVAVIDWYSRYVLSWRLSNSMDVAFCVEALEEALEQGVPEIFNTDQGSQFTSAEFTSILLGRGIKISMDGRGRALDNIFVERLWRSVKYEDIYIKGYQTMNDARPGLEKYFSFYNNVRPHSSLNYRRPYQAHMCAETGESGVYLN